MWLNATRTDLRCSSVNWDLWNVKHVGLYVFVCGSLHTRLWVFETPLLWLSSQMRFFQQRPICSQSDVV